MPDPFLNEVKSVNKFDYGFILKREEDSLASSLFEKKQQQKSWCLIFGYKSPADPMKRTNDLRF